MTRTPIHPGEILKDELAELGISAAALARQIEVPANRVSQILFGRRASPPILRSASPDGSARRPNYG